LDYFGEFSKNKLEFIMAKIKPAEDIPLVPEKDFRKAVRQILSNSKEKSDKDLAKFQASNVAKREAKK
jgi:hypothetical protein